MITVYTQTKLEPDEVDSADSFEVTDRGIKLFDENGGIVAFYSFANFEKLFVTDE